MGIEGEVFKGLRDDKNSNYLVLILIVMAAAIWGSHKVHSTAIDELKAEVKEMDNSIDELKSDVKLIQWREDHD